ncbi:unnamed protein product [Withania somnifera]
MMKPQKSFLIKILVVQCSLVLCVVAQDFDFFYFVQQWPASYCDTRRSCCYPTTGKPDEDFSIHGLWPNYENGKWPQNCDRESSLDESEISDLISTMEKNWPSLACPSSDGVRFWSHEWLKHGTCSTLSQRAYFQTALDFKNKSNLLQNLKNAGIHPRNGEHYGVESIKKAIEEGIGHNSFIECNVDSQVEPPAISSLPLCGLFASNFIDCLFSHMEEDVVPKLNSLLSPQMTMMNFDFFFVLTNLDLLSLYFN